jgi:hypothetical protein
MLATLTAAANANIKEIKELEQKMHVPKIEVGDSILFYRSNYERARDTADPRASGVTKYDPTWSLPSRVNKVKDKQVNCTEIGTGYSRDVPISQCRLLPKDYPPSLEKINKEFLHTGLPRRLPATQLPFDLEKPTPPP